MSGARVTVLTVFFMLTPARVRGTGVEGIRLVLPQEGASIVRNIGELLTRQIIDRCDAEVGGGDDAPRVVELAVVPGSDESFRIEDRSAGGVRIVGHGERGLLYGVGKFLRTSRFDRSGFTPSEWRGTSSPACPIRGIYLATHFHNFYHDAPIEEVQRYVEELGLWGFNTLVVWYDMHHFNGLDSPEAKAFRVRLRGICEAAKNVGLDVGLGVVANEGYANSPTEIRADVSGMRGAKFPTDICPATPAGRRYILNNFTELFDWCADLQPAYVWIWPYDSGGCGCAACRPWGSNGFLNTGAAVAELARGRLPGVRVIMSTWFFDDREWEGLTSALADKPPWANYVLAEGTTRPMPAGLPMVGFPEISMHETFPWGGFGATPLTQRAQREWDKVKQHIVGGFPYSEGIYEDMTKTVFSQFYWDDRPAQDTLREYIAYEFSPDVVDEILQVVSTLEQNHHWRWWPGELEGVALAQDWFPSRGSPPQPDPGAERAYEIVRRVDDELSPRARGNWRWRILYLRALLDAELKANGGRPNERCHAAFSELIEIYHAEHAEPHVRPPLDPGFVRAR